MVKQVRVLVSGTTGVGKTTVARVIEKALKDAGIDVEYFDPDDVNGNMKDFQDYRLAALQDDLKVIIDEYHTRKESYE